MYQTFYFNFNKVLDFKKKGSDQKNIEIGFLDSRMDLFLSEAMGSFQCCILATKRLI